MCTVKLKAGWVEILGMVAAKESETITSWIITSWMLKFGASDHLIKVYSQAGKSCA